MTGNPDQKFIEIDGFRYIAVAAVSGASAGGIRTIHKIDIDASSDPPAIGEKELHVCNGDKVNWVCKRPFLIRFKEKLPPDSSKKEHIFESDPDADPGASSHSKEIAFDGHEPSTTLQYDVIVEIKPGIWHLADPSIIIDENRHLYVLQRVGLK